MEPFNLWTEAFIFITVFTVIIVVPCYFVAVIGRDMMEAIGHFPSKAALFQMQAVIKLVVVEIIAFALLTSFFRIFAD